MTLIAIVAVDKDSEEIVYIASPSPTLYDSVCDMMLYANESEESEEVIFKIVKKKSKAGRAFYICELL